MSSYVQKKERVFKEAGDSLLPRKRSEGRLKQYSSVLDNRAWCDHTEERRQYILELINKGSGNKGCIGSVIPIEAIIDALLATKNADIERLQKKIDELQNLLNKYEKYLTPEQLQKIKQDIDNETDKTHKNEITFKEDAGSCVCEDLNNELTELKKNNMDMHVTLRCMKAQNDLLRNRFEDYELVKCERDRLKQLLVDVSDGMNSTRCDCCDKIKKENDEIRRKYKEILCINTDLKKMVTCLDKIKNERDELKFKFEALTRIELEQREQVSSLKKLKFKKEELQCECNKLRLELTKAQEKFDDLKSECCLLQTKLSKHKSSNEVVSCECIRVKSENCKNEPKKHVCCDCIILRSSNSKKSGLETQINQLQGDLRILQEENNSLKCQNQRAKSEVQQIHEENKLLQNEIKCKTLRYQKLEKQMENQMFNSKKNNECELIITIEKLEKERTKFQCEVKMLKQHIEKNKCVEKEKECLQNKLYSLKRILAEKECVIRKLQCQIESIELSHEALKKKIPKKKPPQKPTSPSNIPVSVIYAEKVEKKKPEVLSDHPYLTANETTDVGDDSVLDSAPESASTATKKDKPKHTTVIVEDTKVTSKPDKVVDDKKIDANFSPLDSEAKPAKTPFRTTEEDTIKSEDVDVKEIKDEARATPSIGETASKREEKVSIVGAEPVSIETPPQVSEVAGVSDTASKREGEVSILDAEPVTIESFPRAADGKKLDAILETDTIPPERIMETLPEDEETPPGIESEQTVYEDEKESKKPSIDKIDQGEGKAEREKVIATPRYEQEAGDTDCTKLKKIASVAIEQLEDIKGIVEDRPDLRRKAKPNLNNLDDEQLELNNSLPGSDEEIEALEREIENMRNSELTPEQEAVVMRKEVEVLKKYCSKLAVIQEENQQLRRDKDMLQKRMNKFTADTGLSDDPNNLRAQVVDLQGKLSNLEHLENEKNQLQNRVRQLENALLKYEDLPAQIEEFKDNVPEKSNDLVGRLRNLENLNDEVEKLKHKTIQYTEIEKKLKDTKSNSSAQIVGLQSDCSRFKDEINGLIKEKDALICRLCCMEAELEKFRNADTENQLLKKEKGKLLGRLTELEKIEAQYAQLVNKLRCFDKVKQEHDMYKRKYEELIGLECECDLLRSQVEKAKMIEKERDTLSKQVCDLQCCIADQEDEIKKLICHIDQLAQGRDDQQFRIKEALLCMRVELERKDQLITTSEMKLATVQDKLRTTIECVSCETTCLRTRIDDLEKNLQKATAVISEKESQIDFLYEHLKKKDSLISNLDADRKASKELAQNEFEAITLMKKELEAARVENERLQQIAAEIGAIGDAHLDELLQQSKCAVLKLNKELALCYDRQDSERDEKPAKSQKTEVTEIVEKRTEESQSTKESPKNEKRGEENIDKSIKTDTCDDEINNLKNIIKKLEEEKKQLETQLKEANDQVNRLISEGGAEDELNHLRNLLAKTKEDLIAAERLVAENQALRRHSSEVQDVAKEQIQDLVARLQLSQQRIIELEEELDKLKRRNAILEEAALKGETPPPAVAEDLCDKFEQENQLFKAEIERLKNLLNSKDYDALKAEFDQLKASKNEIEKVAAMSKDPDQYNALMAEIEKLKQQNKILENAISSGIDPIEFENIKAELEKLKQLNKELQDKLAKSIDPKDFDALRNEIENLQRQNKVLQEAVASGVDPKELDALKAELEKLKHINKGLEDSAASAIDPQQYNDLQKELERLKQQLSSTQESLASAISPSDYNALKAELERMKQFNKSLQDEVSTGIHLDDYNALMTELERQKKQNLELVERLGKSIDLGEYEKLKKEIEKLQKQNSDYQNQITAAQAKIVDLEKVIKEKDLMAAGDNKELEKYLAEIAKLKADLEKAKQDYNKLEANKTDEISRLLKQINDLKEAVDLERGDNSKLQKDSEKVSKLANENEALSKQLEQLKKELLAKSALQDENTKLKGQVSDLQKQNSDLQKQIADLQKQVNELTDKLKTPAVITTGIGKDDIDKERQEKENLLSIIDDLQKQLRNASKQGPSVPEAGPDFQKIIDDLNKQLKAAQDKADINSHKYKEAEEHIARYKEEIHRLKKMIEELHANQLQTLKPPTETGVSAQQTIPALDNAELLKLREELKKLNQINKDLLKQIETCEREKDDMLKNIDSLQQRLNAKETGDNNALTKSYEDQLEQLRASLERQKKECQDTITALKDQYQRDLKNAHDKNTSNIEKLQVTVEETVKEMSNEMEAEIVSLREQLKESQTALLNAKKKNLAEPLLSNVEIHKNEEKKPKVKEHADKKEGATLQKKDVILQKSNASLPKSDALLQKSDVKDAKQKEVKKEKKVITNIVEKKPVKQQIVEGGAKKEVQEEVAKKVDQDVAIKDDQGGVGDVTQKEKVLTKDTFQTTCVCSKFPEVIPIIQPISEFDIKTTKNTTIQLHLNAILNKILQYGMESLSFEELHLLHSRTYNATASMLHDKGRLTYNQPNDKISLMRRITALESELMKKQQNAQQKVADLQVNVKMEKQRLDELKSTLEIEKQKNSDLMNEIGQNSKYVAHLQVDRDLLERQNAHREEKMQQFLYAVETERDAVKSLKDDLEKEKSYNMQLVSQLEKAKKNKMKDAEALKSMKMILDKSLNSEMKLRMQLEQKDKNKGTLFASKTCPCAPSKEISSPFNYFRNERSTTATVKDDLGKQGSTN